jgi:hypothetical protein
MKNVNRRILSLISVFYVTLIHSDFINIECKTNVIALLTTFPLIQFSSILFRFHVNVRRYLYKTHRYCTKLYTKAILIAQHSIHLYKSDTSCTNLYTKAILTAHTCICFKHIIFLRETQSNSKNTIFWAVTPCSPLKVNRRFGGTYRLHLQGWRISRARN